MIEFHDQTWWIFCLHFSHLYSLQYFSTKCRRDSFITHRAFCDALTEENNRVNQGLTSGMPPNLQNQMPDHMSTMPLKPCSNTPSELNNDYDPKNSLRSPPQELVPTIPFRSTNNACGGMFSTTSGALFGGPKALTPTSSSLQLSSNSFNYFHDSKNGSAQMSATALLQKAAQMGATASNSGNSSMMQKSFVSSMVGPDHVSASARPPYSSSSIMMQHNMPSYEHFDLSNMTNVSGGGAFTNQLFQKEQHEISVLFDNNNSTSVSTMNNDIGLFNQISMRNDVAGNDMTRVHDFLGIGGSNSSLHEPVLSQQRLEIMNNFHHHLPHEDSAIEKSIWDV